MKPRFTIKKAAGYFCHYLLLTLAVICFQLKTEAQLTPFEEWTNSTGTQNFFMRSKTVTDGSGNIYVAGATVNGNGNYDILVSKFNSSGVLQWSQQKDGLAGFEDAATALCIDGSGNVYITGFIADTLFHGTDVVTIKYNSSGSEQWVARYNGVGNFHDFGSDIYADGSGNVYVVGTCQNAVPNADFMVIKYNSSGVRTWINIYNYAYDDAAFRIKSISAGKITVAGVIQGLPNAYAYGHLSYNTSSGAIIGSLSMGASSTDIEREFAYTKDDDGNTYIAGAINNGVGYGFDYCVIKFDTSAAIVWERHYNGADGLEDIATDVAVDGDGNVYVTGYTTTATEATNYTTLKFNSAGTQIWEQHYNGEGNGADTAMAITMHSDTTFVITGSSFNGSNQDYYTIKYDTTGTKLWEINYNSYYNKGDAAYCIAVDTLNAIIVTGQSYNDTAFSFTTVKYIDPYINDTLPDAVPVSPSFTFIENRGQLIDTDTLPAPGIKFYNNQQEYASYFTDTLISYVFARIDTSLTVDDTLFRVDMRFVSPLAGAKIRSMHKKREYDNYYLPQTAPGGRERVPHYGQLYMPSLWTNIDLMITSNPAGIKYAFILNPGFDPEKPLLLFEGADDLYIDSDDLIAETELGNLVFPQATVFQIETDGSYTALAWDPDYYINSDIASFTNYGSYDSGLPLVIVIENSFSSSTPSHTGTCWSTYIGGNGDDVMCGIDLDNIGNQYVTGYTESTNYPLSTGITPFQPSNGGYYDCFFTRFNQGHQLDYSTYFGGSEQDEAFDIKLNSQNKIFINGYTYSNNFPKFYNASAYNDTILNALGAITKSDAFIARFNSLTGAREWVTFFGGSENDRATSMDFDSNDNLYMTGFTYSSDFPTATSGTFNPSFGGGIDGYIAKFSSSGAQLWTAYIGGNNQDRGVSICVDPSDNVFIHGVSYSTSGFPHYNTGSQYIDNTLGGTLDNFIVKFSSTASQLWGTFVGGSDDELQAGNDGTGANTIKATNDFVYAIANSRSNDMPLYYPGGVAFIDSTQSSASDWNGHLFQFDATTLAPVWATYVSGVRSTLFSGIDIDDNGNIFIVGGTDDTLFPLQNVAGIYYQDTIFSSFALNGRKDGFLLHFNPQREIKWATYFGGYNTNGSYGEVVNDLVIEGLKLYISGTTTTINNSTRNFPLFDYGSGSYFDTTFNGGLQDGYISYFCLNNVTSIDENPLDDNSAYLVVYPNPTEGNFTLLFPEALQNEAMIDIYDVSGKLILSQLKKNNCVQMNIDLTKMARGIYTLVAHTEQISYFAKIVRQ